MGRIFEVRKHAMFARWNRMAKQFARIGKDITIAVKTGGADPASNPGAAARRSRTRARSTCRRTRSRPAIKRASGRDAANFEEILYEGYAPHGVAVLVECATDNPTRTVAACATSSTRMAATSRRPAASRSSSSAWACSGCNPEGIDQDDLELYLIDHGLEEMGESTGEKGEPQIVARCAVRGLRHAAEGARGSRHRPDLRRARVHLHGPDRAARRHRPPRSSS